MNDILFDAFNDELEKISGVQDTLKSFGRLARRGSQTAVSAVKGTPAFVGDVTRNTYRGFDRRMRNRLNIPSEDTLAREAYTQGGDMARLQMLNRERTGSDRDDWLAATAIQRKFHEPLSRGEIKFDTRMLTPEARSLGSELDIDAILRGIENEFYFIGRPRPRNRK